MGKYHVRNGMITIVGIIGSVAGMSLLFPGSPPSPLIPDPINIRGDNPLVSDTGTGVGNGAGWVIAADESPEGSAWQTLTPALGIKQPPRNAQTAVKRPGLMPSEVISIDNTQYPRRTYAALSFPNDPLANQAWVTNSRLDAAWELSPGAYQTTLAVIDTGFALNHEEFTDRWYRNTGETGVTAAESPSKPNCTARSLPLDYGCNLVDDNVDGIVDNESGVAPYENASQLNCTDRGIPLDKSCNLRDDDGNGYVDDVRGWDMINQDNSPQAGELSPSGSGTTHGTMVAGVAAANANNGKGIAGVNWHTRLLPIQALDDDSYGDTLTVGRAIRYAVQQKVDIINVSLGTSAPDDFVRQAIEEATAAGILVVASSGNDGCECVVYPARYPEVLAVGATDTTNGIASFSSWGSTIDLVAPGTGYTVPSWTAANATARYVSGASGTSFSSPFVAGLAASLKSRQPAAKPLHIIAALRETTDRMGIAYTGVQNAQFGYGRIDASAANYRMIKPHTSVQAYIFSPVDAGGHFGGAGLEGAGNYSVADCEATPRNIRIYEVSGSGGTFYTISEVERRKAESLAYVTPLFADVCLRQPHDAADETRIINIFREFRNSFQKL